MRRCGGCKADLSFARDLPVVYYHGGIGVKCPVCRYFIRVVIHEDGLVKFWAYGTV